MESFRVAVAGVYIRRVVTRMKLIPMILPPRADWTSGLTPVRVVQNPCYQLDRILRRLGELGYITRTARRITYGPRLELEFDAERREAIANASTIYLAGATSTQEDEKP